MATTPFAPQLRGFRAPIVAAEQPRAETSAVSFGDMVRMLAEGIADAQHALDRGSAEMAVELAQTEIDIIPSITEIIDADGNISFKRGAPEKRSLLEIGISPTFYQFSQATVELSMDVHIVETVDTQTKEKRSGLFTSTREVTLDRRFNRDSRAVSKLTATLVPVPSPIRLEPIRNTVTKEG
jgi:hypothetical protein